MIECTDHTLFWGSLQHPKTAQAKGGDTVKAYELLLLIDPTLDEEAIAAIGERVQAAITAEGGVVDEVDDWGKRPLAYEINKQKDGYYQLVNFHHEPFAIAEVERVLRITDGIVRYIVVVREDKE